MSILDSLTEMITGALDRARNEQRQLLEWMLENINDPFAREIEWTPILRGWASFGTHSIVINELWNLEFKTSVWPKVFAGIFVVVGLIIDAVVLISLFASDAIDSGLLIPFFVSSLFLLGWFLLYYYYSKPIVFDKQNGYFYKGKPQMAYGLINPTDKNIVPLSSVRALQIITERVTTKNSSFFSYEINLVLDDKRRVNIVDHGNLERIQADSKQLGEYLGVPVWGL